MMALVSAIVSSIYTVHICGDDHITRELHKKETFVSVFDV